jgi:signal transduction histidine kinase
MSVPTQIKELMFYTTIFLCIFLILVHIDAFDLFYRITRTYEKFELDELILTIPAFTCCLAVFAISRSRTLDKTNRTLTRINKNLLEAQARIQALTASKEEFLTMACHELKTPLNGIIGSLDLARSSRDREEVEECTSLALAASYDLKLMVNDILDFSRLKHGRMKVEREPFQIRTTLEGMRGIIAHQIKTKGLEFHLKVDDGVPQTIVGNEGWIRLATLNILGNAIKFTDRGDITVRCGYTPAPRENLTITIADTGRGISPKSLPRIFQAYTQIREGSPENIPLSQHPEGQDDKGIGLGLYVVKELLEKTDGTIRVQSKLGKGTTFYMTFPLGTASIPSNDG